MKPMPPIRFSRARLAWLDPFLWLVLRRRFRAIHVHRTMEWSPDAVHVLLVQHVGRYDGFVLRQLHRRDAGQSRLMTVMLESQLRRYPVFRGVGAVGIEPGSFGSGRTLLRRLRQDVRPGDCVAIYPQGRIETVDADPRQIQTGFRHLAHPSIRTIFHPVALSVEALHHPRPTVFMQVGTPVAVDHAADAFAETVDHLRAFLRRNGELSAERWEGERLL